MFLDEPSIGLHPRDNDRLLTTLKGLRDLGNTVLVVEHDDETIRAADWIIDLGPGAGVHGGRLIAEGDLQAILDNKDSLTGAYLSGRKKVPLPKESSHGKWQAPGGDWCQGEQSQRFKCDHSSRQTGMHYGCFRIRKINVDGGYPVCRPGQGSKRRAYPTGRI